MDTLLIMILEIHDRKMAPSPVIYTTSTKLAGKMPSCPSTLPVHLFSNIRISVRSDTFTQIAF